MSHNCESIIIHCIDWRLQPGLEKWLSLGAIGRFDRVGLAGAVKSLITPVNRADKEFLLRQISISKTLHGIKKVVLVNHSDCGAYKGSTNFANSEDELDFHKRELQAAADIIKKRFPEIITELYVAELRGQNYAWETTMRKM